MKTITLQVPEDLLEFLDKQAALQDRSRAGIIRALIRAAQKAEEVKIK